MAVSGPPRETEIGHPDPLLAGAALLHAVQICRTAVRFLQLGIGQRRHDPRDPHPVPRTGKHITPSVGNEIPDLTRLLKLPVSGIYHQK